MYESYVLAISLELRFVDPRNESSNFKISVTSTYWIYDRCPSNTASSRLTGDAIENEVRRARPRCKCHFESICPLLYCPYLTKSKSRCKHNCGLLISEVLLLTFRLRIRRTTKLK